MVSPRFYEWIHVFRKKASKKISIRKVWDHAIKLKEEEDVFIVKGSKERGI